MNIADYFELAERADGTSFYKLTDEHPDWLHDAVYEAHDEESPNDWRYDICYSIALAIDEGEDGANNLARGLTDDSAHDLFQWLAADTSRLAYCDYAPGEYDGIEGTIRFGQYVAIEQMAQIMLDAVAENVEGES